MSRVEFGNVRDIENLMTQLIARDVATGVELARSIGHRLPRSYDVGVRFSRTPLVDRHARGWRTRICIRLDDASVDSVVDLPALDGSVGHSMIERMWREAWGRIHGDALTVASFWLDKHPEAFAAKPDAERWIGELDRLRRDPELEAEWLRSANERAKRLTYAISRRP